MASVCAGMTTTARKVLLLDYDGVMLVHPTLREYQARRSAVFVQRHTNMPLDRCRFLNDTNYPKYGHTVNMINKMYQRNISLEEYNDFVFAKKHLMKLSKLLDKQAISHTKEFDAVFKACEQDHIEYRVFTNAPATWVLHFSQLAKLTIDEENIIWPFDTDHMKPSEVAYDDVEKQFEEGSTFLFVDDSPLNLKAVSSRKRWHPFLFTDGLNTPIDVIRLIKESDWKSKLTE